MMSLDEAYLDFGRHLALRRTLSKLEKSVIERLCDECINLQKILADKRAEISLIRERIGLEDEPNNESLGTSRLHDLFDVFHRRNSDVNREHFDRLSMDDAKTTLTQLESEMSEITQLDGGGNCEKCVRRYFGDEIEDAVEEMRLRVYCKTNLTCSAGIAPNRMVAKICSDQNKPNGQFRVANSLEAVLAFVRPLPVRKIPGIGKRTEATLSMGFDIRTVDELYLKRHLLPFGFKQATLRHFAQVMWGHAESFSDTSSSDREQKQMGCERTFSATRKREEIFSIMTEIAQHLSADLIKRNLKGRSVTLKIKTSKFELFTRSKTLPSLVQSAEELLSIGKQLFDKNFGALDENFRLLGLSVSKLGDEKSTKNTILQFWKTKKREEVEFEQVEQEELRHMVPSESVADKENQSVDRNKEIKPPLSEKCLQQRTISLDGIHDRKNSLKSQEKKRLLKRRSLEFESPLSRFSSSGSNDASTSGSTNLMSLNCDPDVKVTNLATIEEDVKRIEMACRDTDRKNEERELMCPICFEYFRTITDLDNHIFAAKCEVVARSLRAVGRFHG